MNEEEEVVEAVVVVVLDMAEVVLHKSP